MDSEELAKGSRALKCHFSKVFSMYSNQQVMSFEMC